MANTAKKREFDPDDEDTLTEVGEEHDFADVDEDETDTAERRRDPLRLPY